MKSKSYERVYESQEFFSPLGNVSSRSLFGGYSLSIDDTVFAMVSEGELYLRACEQTQPYFSQHQVPVLAIHKRGRPVRLNYFRVGESLWQNPETLMDLAAKALQSAREEKSEQGLNRRPKDLPNITLYLELLLFKVGIVDEFTLKLLGSRQSWLMVRKLNKALDVRTLYALEGAICGLHVAALPAQIRQELREWLEDQMAEHNRHTGS
ncbi:TfoX/Sxy family DNA transformation protein [Entomohabitans teleogrylli]|uniref:TfoX/Sxy family DNA transformation protein n=1 Tax=Entomohabitans teleogrylli TaxID=1384589 RepID=UPI00073D9480|nr:TfoX/Sxy family DNA transformation protein [Entomohabitans teleogrylli]